jgi:hypothetical protein
LVADEVAAVDVEDGDWAVTFRVRLGRRRRHGARQEGELSAGHTVEVPPKWPDPCGRRPVS